MNYPRKAVLLAAGHGTRMRPLSFGMPKCLMPLWGKPLIGHMIELLLEWGVTEILVNLHNHPWRILSYLRDNYARSVRMAFSFEPAILGTGGAIKRAAWFIHGPTAGRTDESPFWIANTDIAADVDPDPFLTEFRVRDPLAVLWLHPTEGPRTVEMQNGAIATFKSARPGGDGTYTFCGLQLVSPRLLRYLTAESFAGLTGIYERAMLKGEQVRGMAPANTFWADLGTPDAYLAGHRAVLDRRRMKQPGSRLAGKLLRKPQRLLNARDVQISGFAAIGENVAIAASAQIHDSVVWNGATLTAGARISDAIVAENTVVTGQTRGIAIRCDGILPADIISPVLTRLKWRMETTTALPLAARGSGRSFIRLRNGRRSAMLVLYGTERQENALYAAHSRFLRAHGVAVPKVLVDLPDRQLEVFQDMGDRTLESQAADCPLPVLEELYKAVLDQLAALHAIPLHAIRRDGIVTQAPFCGRLYRWERELMARYFLTGHLHLPNRTISHIMHDLQAISKSLKGIRHVLIHRDMQSSNVLMFRGSPCLIDFQGMRPGPAAYDVASLLCDPYVMLPEDIQLRLLDYYLARSNRREVAGCFWPAAVQRLTQALGAFGRLSTSPGTARFARYFEPALLMMERALNHLDGFSRLKDEIRGHVAT